MDDVKVYWRDRAIQLVGWGTAAFVAIAGWTLDKSGRFELGPFAGDSHDPGNRLRAIGLLLFAVAFPPAWYGAVRWIYEHHLSHNTDDTVLPWRYIRRYMILIVALQFVVAALVALT